jgi:hypothetical protein
LTSGKLVESVVGIGVKWTLQRQVYRAEERSRASPCRFAESLRR